MTTSTANKTVGTTLLTTQLVQSNAVVVGPEVSMSNKFAATVFARVSRTPASLGSGNAPVLQIEGRSNATSGWVPIYTWTTALHTVAPNQQTFTSNAAAGAVSVQLSAALGSALSSPLCIYNSATPANSEWNWQRQASTNPTLNNSLANAQTTAVSVAISHAEMWAIPLDVSTFNHIRLVVNNIWNAVAAPYVANAEVTTFDSVNTA